MSTRGLRCLIISSALLGEAMPYCKMKAPTITPRTRVTVWAINNSIEDQAEWQNYVIFAQYRSFNSPEEIYSSTIPYPVYLILAKFHPTPSSYYSVAFLYIFLPLAFHLNIIPLVLPSVVLFRFINQPKILSSFNSVTLF